MNRKEFDEKIKKSLIVKYGVGEFKATWDEIADTMELQLQKAKYHIYKLEEQGFLKVVARSQRSGGYTSPNVITIFDEETREPKSEDITISRTEAENVLEDADKHLDAIKTRLRSIQTYEEEVRKLTKQNHELEAINKRLYQEALQLREKVYELTRLG